MLSNVREMRRKSSTEATGRRPSDTGGSDAGAAISAQLSVIWAKSSGPLRMDSLAGAALLVSADVLEEIDVTADDVSAGMISTLDILSSGYLPFVAEYTGVFEGTKVNPMLAAVDCVTIVGTHSPSLAPGDASNKAEDKDIAELMAEMDAQDTVTVSDVFGTLKPNIVGIFGGETDLGTIMASTIAYCPMELLDVSGVETARPFIAVVLANKLPSSFVGFCLDEHQTTTLRETMLAPLEVSKPHPASPLSGSRPPDRLRPAGKCRGQASPR